MEKGWLLALMAAAALVMRSHGVEGWKDDEVKVMHVGGKVLCQDCTKGWDQWVHGATPLKGSKVSVTCMDARNRAVYHASDLTDEKGEFDMLVNKLVYGKEIKPEWCSVRLVSSPEPACSVATDFGRGRSGVKLRRPSHVYQDLLRYTVGPFYFTSPMCEEPDTTQPDAGNGY